MNRSNYTAKERTQLTPREVQIVNVIAVLGLSNKEAGNRFGISEQTVRTHVKSILKKSGLKSRSLFWMLVNPDASEIN